MTLYSEFSAFQLSSGGSDKAVVDDDTDKTSESIHHIHSKKIACSALTISYQAQTYGEELCIKASVEGKTIELRVEILQAVGPA